MKKLANKLKTVMLEIDRIINSDTKDKDEVRKQVLLLASVVTEIGAEYGEDLEGFKFPADFFNDFSDISKAHMLEGFFQYMEESLKGLL